MKNYYDKLENELKKSIVKLEKNKKNKKPKKKTSIYTLESLEAELKNKILLKEQSVEKISDSLDTELNQDKQDFEEWFKKVVEQLKQPVTLELVTGYKIFLPEYTKKSI